MVDYRQAARDGVEYWKLAHGFPGYRVSNLGQVHNNRGTILKPRVRLERSAHQYVYLARDGKQYSVAIHHLVLLSFGVMRPEGYECRHLDDVADNNRLYNLKWGTHKENGADMVRNGNHARGVARGDTAGQTKIPDAEISKIIRRAMMGELHKHIARDYGVHQTTISSIIRVGRAFALVRG